MSERKQYTFISATSNTMVTQRPTRLHGVIGFFPAGGSVRIDDSHRFPQGTLNINSASSNTLGYISGQVTELDILANVGLVVAVTSNAQVTIIHEDL